jgi:hypothetical protein
MASPVFITEAQYEQALALHEGHTVFLMDLNPNTFTIADYQPYPSLPLPKLLTRIAELQRIAGDMPLEAFLRTFVSKIQREGKVVPARETCITDNKDTILRHLRRMFVINGGLFELLEITGGVIAGSAALSVAAELLKGPTFAPGDLDIWVHSSRFPERVGELKETCTEEMMWIRKSALWMYNQYFTSLGYKEVSPPSSSVRAKITFMEEDGYQEGPLASVVRNIQRFEHSVTKTRVQVMHCYVSPCKAIATFDLSVCATWFNGAGHLYAMDAQGIETGKYFYLRSERTEREKERAKKYKEREYFLVERDASKVVEFLQNQ